jgi:hypothetical protein
MDWRCGSSGRAPALEVQRHVFKFQSHEGEEKREERRGQRLLYSKLFLLVRALTMLEFEETASQKQLLH